MRLEDLVPAVVAHVSEYPECAQADIEKAISGRREVIREAIAAAVDRGLIQREKAGQRWVHRPLAPTRPDSPRLARGEPRNLASSPIWGRGRG